MRDATAILSTFRILGKREALKAYSQEAFYRALWIRHGLGRVRLKAKSVKISSAPLFRRGFVSERYGIGIIKYGDTYSLFHLKSHIVLQPFYMMGYWEARAAVALTYNMTDWLDHQNMIVTSTGIRRDLEEISREFFQ